LDVSKTCSNAEEKEAISIFHNFQMKEYKATVNSCYHCFLKTATGCGFKGFLVPAKTITAAKALFDKTLKQQPLPSKRKGYPPPTSTPRQGESSKAAKTTHSATRSGPSGHSGSGQSILDKGGRIKGLERKTATDASKASPTKDKGGDSKKRQRSGKGKQPISKETVEDSSDNGDSEHSVSPISPEAIANSSTIARRTVS